MNICVINGRKYLIDSKKLKIKNTKDGMTINGRPLSDYPSEPVGSESGGNIVINGNGIQIDSITSLDSRGHNNVVISNNSSDFEMPKEFHEAMAMLKNMFKK